MNFVKGIVMFQYLKRGLSEFLSLNRHVETFAFPLIRKNRGSSVIDSLELTTIESLELTTGTTISRLTGVEMFWLYNSCAIVFTLDISKGWEI